MLLRKVKNEDTVFKGRLKKEKTRVAVTIEDPSNLDDIEVVSLNFLCFWISYKLKKNAFFLLL